MVDSRPWLSQRGRQSRIAGEAQHKGTKLISIVSFLGSEFCVIEGLKLRISLYDLKIRKIILYILHKYYSIV